MVNIHNLSVSFQGDYVFEKITFQLKPGDRVGLVGKNGAGKSTLLKIIAGEQEYDTGQIATDKEISIGFLKQDIDFEKGRTVLEESYEAFTEIKKLEKQLAEINKQLAERTDYESDGYHQLMVDLNEIQHQYEIHGGYNYQGETERILQGLGFQREDFTKLTETFSGGWRMRIELAKLLLQNNDILLLDEPTNHLDIESILWLEEFLKGYTGAVVIVSHDKMFLDNVTNRTIEISLGKIYDFNKPYSQYLVLRNELRGQQLASQKNQQKQIEQTEKVIEAENISKNYGDKEVLKNVNLLVDRDSKIAFVGQNGQGKSTLAKIIVGEITYQGKLTLGHNVQIGYFAQNQADYLDGSKTVLDTMIDAANEKNRSKVRDILGSFLFRGDEVEKYVRVLSGGERNRLALAKLLLQPFNVLVMDEPTNHLDIKSKNVLKGALKSFEGTLILVSHDRDFLQGLTNKVYEFKDRHIKEYLGDIDYFLEQRNLQNLREAEKRTVVTEVKEKRSAGEEYEIQKKLKSAKNKLSNVEASIAALEKEIANIDTELLINYEETIAKPHFFDKYQEKKKKLKKLMEEWEVLQETVESLS